MVDLRPIRQPQGKKILIIKLAAAGDVLRTTPILRGLRRKYKNIRVTWLTRSSAVNLLEGNGFIDRLLPYGRKAIQLLETEDFDILISLDKEPAATSLATRLRAKKKIGFGLDKTGNLIPLNKESLYAFRLGICDELKFRQNRKSYPEIIFEMAGIKYNNDEYILNVSDADKAYAKKLLSKIGAASVKPAIGLNTGAGSRFANKAWTEDGFVELIRMIGKELPVKIILLGGPEELRRNRRILARSGNLACDSGCGNTLGQFASIIDACSLVVSGDTTALHIAIALKKKTLALFGSTCAQEIELYGRGIKIVPDIKCRPCYRNFCDKQISCMDLIKPAEVFQAIRKLLPGIK